MARRKTKPIRWDEISFFDSSTVDAKRWHTAQHEAAHFLVAVAVGYRIHAVWLRMPGGRIGYLNHGVLGRVSPYDPLCRGGLCPEEVAITLAGPNLDFYLLDEKVVDDPGYQYDRGAAKREITAAMRSRYSGELFRSHTYQPTEDELEDVSGHIGLQVHRFLKPYMWLVEDLAAGFLTHVTKSTGEVHSDYIHQLLIRPE